MLLKASDGRLFAMYVEFLPESLDRGALSGLNHDDAWTILHDMSLTLAYLHSKGVVHYDIKPGNIVYSSPRSAVLLDFGQASQADDPVPRTGTPWYVPPEYQTANSRGAAGDIWALGVTMLHVLKKTRLPERATMMWWIRDVQNPQSEAAGRMEAWLRRIARIRSELNRANKVEDLVYSMLDVSPQQRIREEQIHSRIESQSV